MNLDFLVEKCQAFGRLEAAIVDPRSEVSLNGAVQAFEKGILEPVLVGPKAEIEQIANKAGLNISALRIVDAKDDQEALPNPLKWQVLVRYTV